MAIAGCNNSKPSGAKPEVPSKAIGNEATPLPPADLTLSAEELAKDYADVASEDMKFKGKTLRVTGKVDKVTEDALGVTFVKLKGNDKLSLAAVFQLVL